MSSRQGHRLLSQGFTMIELLMTIAIIAILGATALPNFLDFRREAKAAALRQMLATMRVGIKNQIQQAQLKCNMGANLRALNSDGVPYGFLVGESMEYNDITTWGSLPGHTFCTPAHIPDLENRKFWATMPDSERAHSTTGSGAPTIYGYMFKNPFVVDTGTGNLRPVAFFNASNPVAGAPSACALISYYSALGNRFHWFYNYDTGEIFAGTNTTGVSECSF